MLCLTNLLPLVLQWNRVNFCPFEVMSVKLENVTCLEEENITFGGFNRKPNFDMRCLIKINGY